MDLYYMLKCKYCLLCFIAILFTIASLFIQPVALIHLMVMYQDLKVLGYDMFMISAIVLLLWVFLSLGITNIIMSKFYERCKQFTWRYVHLCLMMTDIVKSIPTSIINEMLSIDNKLTVPVVKYIIFLHLVKEDVPIVWIERKFNVLLEASTVDKVIRSFRETV